jgi:O-antigen ligase
MARRLRNSSGPALTVLWLASVSSWLVACGLNRLAFQRYFEPPILVFLISWLALLSHSQGESDPERVRYRPLLLLAALQACVSVVTTFIPVLAA